jgi:hypothetical protein
VAGVGSPNERNFKANKHEVSLWSQYGVLVVIGIKKYGYLVKTAVEDRWENVGTESKTQSSNSRRGEGMYLVIGLLHLP